MRVETVGSVFSVEFNALLFEVSDKLCVENELGFLQGNALTAAARWVQGLICHGGLEECGETLAAVVVVARSFEHIKPGQVFAAGNTSDVRLFRAGEILVFGGLATSVQDELLV